MNQRSESTNQLDPYAENIGLYTVGSQAWWCGTGDNAISQDRLEENALSLSSLKHPSDAAATIASKLNAIGGQDKEDGTNKATQTTVLQQSDEHEQQHITSIKPLTMGEYLPPPQLEVNGHSIQACTSYRNSDPYYQGILAAYGPQALVHSNALGVHQTRMALPLEVTEEPVYVNAKQYHGILRRRQSRAKAELEKKMIKARKPYLHESRHLHAMKRARGSGGRFLNTKKLNSAAHSIPSDKGTGSGMVVSAICSNSLGSKSLPTNSSESADSSISHKEVEPSMQNIMQSSQTFFSCNVNINNRYPYHQGFQMSSFYSFPHEKVDGG